MEQSDESWKTDDFIPIETITEAFGVKKWMARIVMRGMGIRKMNRFFKTLLPVENKVALFHNALRIKNITLDIDQKFYDQLPDGPFFTISNHAFGLLDGVILVSEIGRKHPGLKVTANYLLSGIKALKEFFVPVNPFDKIKHSGMGGTNAVLDLIEKGTPVGLFPAGEVATYHNSSKEITDRQWMKSVFRLIELAQVPVIPLFFQGTNSKRFHRLGKIHPMLRTWRLMKEWHNKDGKTIRMETGDIIYPEQYNKFETPEEKRKFFRDEVYKLR